MRPRRLLTIWTLGCGGLFVLIYVLYEVDIKQVGAHFRASNPGEEFHHAPGAFWLAFELAFPLWLAGIILPLAWKGLVTVLREGEAEEHPEQERKNV